MLIDAGCDVSLAAAFDYSALGLASLKGYLRIVESLLNVEGVNIEAQNANGATPLLLAASANHFDVVAALLQSGANVNAQDKSGTTLLHILARSDRRDLITAVVRDYCADIEAREDRGDTALLSSVRAGRLTNSKVIIRAGGDINARNDERDTALHLAVSEGNEEIFKYILTVGADAQLENKHRFKAIDLAYMKSQTHMVQILRSYSTLAPDIDEKVHAYFQSKQNSEPSMSRRGLNQSQRRELGQGRTQ